MASLDIFRSRDFSGYVVHQCLLRSKAERRLERGSLKIVIKLGRRLPSRNVDNISLFWILMDELGISEVPVWLQ